MGYYSFTTRGIDGRATRGRLAAQSLEEAVFKLQEAGVYVTSVSPAQNRRFHLALRRAGLSYPERIFFLESLMTFLEAGIPLQSALLRIRVRTRWPALARAVDQIQRQLDQGSGITEAFRRSRALPSWWVGILSIAEKQGDLIYPLRLLYQNTCDLHRFKREIFSALLLPFLLLFLTLIWFCLVVVRLVPCIAQLLPQTGVSLPWGDALAGLPWGLWVLPILGFLLLGLAWSLGGNRLVNRLNLYILFSGLKMQTEAGLSFQEALETLGKGFHSRSLRQDLLLASRKLNEGMSVAAALDHLRILPPMAQALLAAGEVSGNFPLVLGLLANDAQAAVRQQVERLSLAIRHFAILSIGLLMAILFFIYFNALYQNLSSLSLTLSSSPW